MAEQGPHIARRVVFQYLAPVHVEVEDGLVTFTDAGHRFG